MIIDDIPLPVLKDQLAKNTPLAIVTTESLIERLEKSEENLESALEANKRWAHRSSREHSALFTARAALDRVSTLFEGSIIDHGNGITENINATIRATIGQGHIGRADTRLDEEALEKAALAMCRYVVANREFSQGISPAYHQTQSAKAAVTAYLSALPDPAMVETADQLDALAVGSVAIDAQGDLCKRLSVGWVGIVEEAHGDPWLARRTEDITLPAIVLLRGVSG